MSPVDGSLTGDWYPDERSRSEYWRRRAMEAEDKIAAAVAEERRACAVLAEEVADLYVRSRGHCFVAHEIAERIRRRS